MRVERPRRKAVRKAQWLTLTLVLGLAVSAGAQNPPAPPLTPQQQERLKERDRYAAEVLKLRQAGQLAEATAAAEKKLALERAVFGVAHADAIGSLEQLAGLYAEREEFAAARKARQQVLALRRRLHGEGHWRVTNARLALAHVERLASLDGDQRQRLGKANQLHSQAAQMYRQGKFPEAIRLTKETLAVRREVLGERHPDYASSLNNLAVLYLTMGDFAQAEPLQQQALAVRKEVLGERHPDYAASLNSLAVLYRAMGVSARTEPLLQQALTIRKETLGERHPGYAQSLHNLANMYKDMGAFAQAEPLLQQALVIRKEAEGEHHPHYATSLSDLAILYRVMGTFAQAEPLYQQARAIRKKALGERHPDYAQSLNSLANLYWDMGAFAQAEALYLQALAIRKEAVGELHPDYAASLNNLAGLYRAMGASARAEPLNQQARAIYKEAVGERHPDYATSVNNLANLYWAMGAFAKAEPLYQQALVLRKETVGERHSDYAQSLNNLANLYKDMGAFTRAESLYQQARAIYREALGERHPDYALSLNNLANLYQAMGTFAQAEPLYQLALVIRKEALSERHPDYAQSLNNLAVLHQAMGAFVKAEPLLQQALTIRKKTLSERHPEYAQSLNNLAVLHQAMGAFVKAEPLLQQALAIRKEALSERHPDYAASLNNLAWLYKDMGAYAKAEPLLRQALTIQEQLLQDTFAIQSEGQRLQLLRHLRRYLENYLTVALTARELAVADLYRHILAWKGSVAARQAEDRLAHDHPELKDLLDQLARARAGLSHLIFRVPPPTGRDDWLKQLRKLYDEKDDLESRLAAQSQAFRVEKERRQLGPTEVSRVLPPGVVLVDLLEYSQVLPAPQGKGKGPAERRLLAFVLGRDREPILVRLGQAAPVTQAVETWRQALAQGDGQAMQAAAADLARRVWEPLRPHLAGATTVLVAPDGALARFPLAALPGQKPGSYLLEELAIAHVTSGRHAVEVFTAPAKPTGRGLLAIGGIQYTADPPARAKTIVAATRAPLLEADQRGGFGPLAGTGLEVRRLRELFRQAVPGAPALLLMGAEPHETRVKQEAAKGYRYLHLATHGFFEAPTRLAALRAGPGDLGGLAAAVSDQEATTLALMPLLHSGLVLAGAARPPASGELNQEDGILTAEEVAGLDLRRTELVVLSACDTGLGQLEAGEGALGLQRAFQAAGARTLVTSLWKVNDAATSVLMEAFYTNLWHSKLPKLEALRQAQLTVLRNPKLVQDRDRELDAEFARRGETRGPKPKAVDLPKGGVGRSHPRDWAAFVLSGAPES